MTRAEKGRFFAETFADSFQRAFGDDEATACEYGEESDRKEAPTRPDHRDGALRRERRDLASNAPARVARVPCRAHDSAAEGDSHAGHRGRPGGEGERAGGGASSPAERQLLDARDQDRAAVDHPSVSAAGKRETGLRIVDHGVDEDGTPRMPRIRIDGAR